MKKITKLSFWLLAMLFASTTMFAQTANSVFDSQIDEYLQNGDINQAKNMVVQMETMSYKKVSIDLKGKGTAYAYVAYDPTSTNPAGPAMLETADGTVASLAATTSAKFIAAGTWADGTWYGAEYDDGSVGGGWWTIDETDGTMTQLGSGSASLNGIAYDGTTMYGCSSTDLYSIDMATGAQTLIGAMGNGGGVMIGLACDGTTLYGVDLGDDSFYTIDMTTGAATMVGSLGIDLNYAQDAEFDKDNGVLYLSAYTTGGMLYTVDVATGTATYVADFTGGAEMTGFAIPYAGVTYTTDMALVSITAPNSGVDLSNAEAVTIKVKNNGTTDQSNFDVNFVFDGTTYTETITATVAPGDNYTHTFATTVDLSTYGTYDFEANVMVSGDENPANDHKTKTVENIEPSLCIDGLYTTGCSLGDGLTAWDLADVNGLTIGCDGTPNAWYHDWRTTYVHTMTPGETYTLTAQCGYSNTYVRIWIDFNDNLMTEANEMLVDNFNMPNADVDYEISITIPADAVQGSHTLRYRTNWNSPLAGEGCETYTYGNMVDFGTMIGDPPPSWNPPTNLTATAIGMDAELMWDTPSKQTLTGYEVYRDGALLTTLGVVNNYLDAAPGYGTFTYCVKAVYDDGTSECSEEAVASFYDPTLLPVTNLVGSASDQDVTLTWTEPGGSTPEDFFEDFEGGTLPTGWIAIDNDGDGYNWVNTIEDGLGFDAYEGDGAMTSASYMNGGVGALTPDNWLITPAIAVSAGSVLSYWHDAQDAAWADEHYYVKVSTTGTDLADFTDIIYDGITPGEWAQVTINLDAYAGQTCYFAIQHTEVTDMFYMKIDNFSVSSTKTKSQFTPPVAAAEIKGMPFKTKGMSNDEITAAMANYSSKSAKALTGYDVYKDGTFMSNVTTTSYAEAGVAYGVHTYTVHAVYEEGVSVGVSVDVNVENNNDYYFYEDFEDGASGDQVACTVNDPAVWTTWDNAPCSSTDAYYSDEQVFVGATSMVVEDDNDMVHVFDNLQSGIATIEFEMYIPAGKLAYWNTLQLFSGSASKWGMQIQYQSGTATLDAAGAAATTFSYAEDVWTHNKLIVNLNADEAELIVDGTSIYTWQWSEGANGGNDLNQLGGNNFYGWTGKGVGKYFIDEYIVNYCCDLPPVTDLVGTVDCPDVNLTWNYEGCENFSNYNVYRDGDLIGAPTSEMFTDADPGDGSYVYTVKAVCDGFESPGATDEVVVACNVTVPEVINLTLDVATGTHDVTVAWDEPAGLSVLSHCGDIDPENAIGLTSGGTFSAATKFEPTNMNGSTLDAIEFGPAGDGSASFTLKVWEGNSNSPTEIYSQEVTSYNPLEWNTVELTTPIEINPLKTLWFGYETTHEAGNSSGGIDAGPAETGGDMISTGGDFVAMGAEYGLDYNWAIRGHISFAGTYTIYHHLNAGTSYSLLVDGLTETSYLHANAEEGLNFYKVHAVYDGEESPEGVEESILVAIENNVASVTSIFPNPAVNVITVTSDVNIENVKVYDVAGRLVKEVAGTNTSTQLDVTDMNGVYMLQITTESGLMNAKVIVK